MAWIVSSARGVGGWRGGGGEPKSMDPLGLEKRMEANYDIDKNGPRRRSDENHGIKAP